MGARGEDRGRGHGRSMAPLWTVRRAVRREPGSRRSGGGGGSGGGGDGGGVDDGKSWC